MKKIFISAVFIGALLFVFQFFYGSERASGADKSQSIGIEEQNGTEQVGPPWYDPAWNYRSPVRINNSGEFLNYYQVLITLDINNYNFDHALADGSDLRITDSSGRNPITLFWIESWDKPNKIAYVWVLVSSIAPNPYNPTIYLYYGNPTPDTINPTTPFDFFDDSWNQSLWANCLTSNSTPYYQSSLEEGTNTFPTIDQSLAGIKNMFNHYFLETHTILDNYPWCVTNGTPSVSSGILNLQNGTGIKTTTAPGFLHQALGFRANYGLGNGHEWAGFINGTSGQQTIIGDLPLPINPHGLYLINYQNDSSTQLGSIDWHNTYHTYELRWVINKSLGYIDHNYKGENLNLIPTGYLPLTLSNNNSGSESNLMVDWVYVRQYREPEPMSEVGIEQGLVDLGINMIDSPDPLPQGAHLSYLITITNDSSADATGLVITDTLPASVVFTKPLSSQGCNQAGSNIVCSVNLIGANSTASVTISAYPTTDGVITNRAEVGSLGFETNLINNTAQAVTLVDSIKPVVIWEQPVGNRQTYVTDGGEITLEASATDNDQISRVEFKWFDGKNDTWNLIDTAYSPTPANSSKYRITFSSNILTPNIDNPVEVYAFDRAGNENDLEDKRQVIYVHRIAIFRFYLPITPK